MGLKFKSTSFLPFAASCLLYLGTDLLCLMMALNEYEQEMFKRLFSVKDRCHFGTFIKGKVGYWVNLEK